MSATARGLAASLRKAPTTVSAMLAMALFILWATDQAGYPVTHWAPGALIVLALLGIAVVAAPPRIADIPASVRIALGCMAGYTALSFASILWAAVPGEAWEGANRTLLYVLVFALFACWPQRGSSAALLLAGWTLAMIVLAGFVVLHLDAASSASLASLMPGGRLVYPSGYANANAAQWLMAFWPALLLARERALPWALRGVLAGGAVLLAACALLSQSRGSLYSLPVMVVLVFALLPARVRTFALLAPVAAGIAAVAPAVLRVGDHLRDADVAPATLHSAIVQVFAAAVAVGVVVALGAALERHRTLTDASARQVHRATAAVALATLAIVLVGGLIAAGNPVSRVKHGWDTFKQGYGADQTTGSRLTSGLGSNRYDFYRVGLDEFAAHPIVGIGADNFQEQYLAHGRSEETPRYPHSVEVRTLAQTGLLGALLALVGLGAALCAGWSALHPRDGARAESGLAAHVDPLRGGVAAAALAGFAYWLVHGSFDWFWEFAGLGAPAFALLGIACALAPRPPAGASGARGGVGRRVRVVGAIVVALAIVGSLTAPWLSQLQLESAARIWSTAPKAAYSRLDDAARLDPLSDEAYVLAGNIALRFDDLARADRDFSLALGRTPGDAYATLERGAIASTNGDRGEALTLLTRAARLSPRDPLIHQALSLVREGRRLSVQELNRSILLKAQQLV